MRDKAFFLTRCARFWGLCLLAGVLLAALGQSPCQAGTNWLEKGKSFLGGAATVTPPGSSGLSDGRISSGLKDLLRVASENVVARLGHPDGFNLDPAVHIPLPGQLDTVRSVLSKVGKSQMLDDLELRLNRAAEAAAPKAKDLFLDAIRGMTLEDVRKIYEGPDDAATRYFRSKMSKPLAQEMSPIVSESLLEVDALQSYDRVMKEYQSVPFVPDARANLTEYVTEKAMDGIFYYMGKEEAAIRRNPAKRTTDLLKELFGS
ncbi:Protein of unknown function [Desulfacinum hydrothermale DSM 13146]|uniref:DUF4197 domain-containing protein n=1 Tax=Desulfacinum hydrothermale DSM 13146 TaxID=1121390 RepID=A0A1W1XMF6_9BACT|nr:DUF4197 domain-containing protein [Desulfacinum hydrothermale]SMC25133.1 Protein of unknown function [Desulfacinum hydrothermale DSM 13146]